MSNQDQTTDFPHRVVISDEERYSIWPTYKPIPHGWRDGGFEGPKQACLDHIAVVWTDMRPLSLRRQMDGDASANR
ncbi:MbtH family NRPS accessory protein [Agrobacterium tumefaciens]|uniref:Antibiotic synthesis protein MbtH n=1 Tax=Agrobacterium tumefaciens TaxID=358 RepID=A0A2L2LIE3_AGRTU|nr:MbtH family NRPS accessory protein [Agrobacterium tumefaciens]AVH44103.1 antibiotic synthesis protein MbtH [Agrobacterium tumefaciens]NSY98027.1 MbtH family NRPS accessory protein [Agrobacterium tumefaciens]NSZ03820.1 MbtH family NRPS accessory protein [Agrobacterium tumefaciens]NSZ39356.1 MbtH family NRPS accessory protein [Agrobacterium tumefaciens]NTB04561.1 MbtH family NRPS accessory protein [Agrobacterium tumefaciens]